MNFKQKAAELEIFLQEELKKELPVAILPDKSIVYKNYRVKPTKKGLWNLTYAKTGDYITNFRTKSAALLGAKFYDKNRFQHFNEVRLLDTEYWNNLTNCEIFKYRISTAKDLDRKDMLRSRYDLAHAKTKRSAEKLSLMFKTHF